MNNMRKVIRALTAHTARNDDKHLAPIVHEDNRSTFSRYIRDVVRAQEHRRGVHWLFSLMFYPL